MKTICKLIIVCFIIMVNIAICCQTKTLESIAADNTVEKNGNPSLCIGNGVTNIYQLFVPEFTVTASYKTGSTIQDLPVNSGYTCSGWSWDVSSGTDPAKVTIVTTSTSCDATVRHRKDGGDSMVTIAATVSYTYLGKTAQDNSTGNTTFND